MKVTLAVVPSRIVSPPDAGGDEMLGTAGVQLDWRERS